jgi:hypothetical protein
LAVPFKLPRSRPVEYLEIDEIQAVLTAIDRTTADGRRDYESQIPQRALANLSTGDNTVKVVDARSPIRRSLQLGVFRLSLGSRFDALVFDYYEGAERIYAARTRNGFTPKLRAELLWKFKPLETSECPFANLPEKKAGRGAVGLTAAKTEECRWLSHGS